MGIEFFNNKDKERKHEERMYEIALQAKNDAISESSKISKGDLARFELKHDEEYKNILNEVCKMYNHMQKQEQSMMIMRNDYLDLLKQLEELKEEKEKNNNEGKLTFSDVVSQLSIPGLTTTYLKYYFSEIGVMEKRINPRGNCFYALTNMDKDNKLSNYIHVKTKTKMLFDEEIVSVLKEQEKDIALTMKKCKAVQKQYEKSKSNLENTNAEQYRQEIVRICGTESSKPWKRIYKEFSKKFPTFKDDFDEYAKEHPMNGKFKTSKVYYVVTKMHQGAYLLKIACELFVKPTGELLD